jgi:hypothetical protein
LAKKPHPPTFCNFINSSLCFGDDALTSGIDGNRVGHNRAKKRPPDRPGEESDPHGSQHPEDAP